MRPRRALLPVASALALGACNAPSAAPLAAPLHPQGGLSPAPFVPSELRTVPRQVELDSDSRWSEALEAPRHLDGYARQQMGEIGLPHAGARPRWRWPVPAGREAGPLLLDAVPVPADGATQVLGWIDLNRTGRLDTGDACSVPLPPLPAGAAEQVEGPALRVHIHRIYVALEASGDPEEP